MSGVTVSSDSYGGSVTAHDIAGTVTVSSDAFGGSVTATAPDSYGGSIYVWNMAGHY